MPLQEVGTESAASGPIHPPGFHSVPTAMPGQPPGIAVPAFGKPHRSHAPWLIIGSSLLVVVALVVLAVQGNIFAGLLSASGAPTPTSQTTPSPLTGPITDNFTVNTNGWPVGNLNGDTDLKATLDQGTYTISISPGQGHNSSFFLIPARLGSAPARFTLEINAQELSGSDTLGFGVIVRESNSRGMVDGYAFTIAASGGYEWVKYPSSATSASFTDRPDIIHAGLSRINDLKVVAHGSTYTFYVNGQVAPLGANGTPSITDTSYTTGSMGLLVTGDGENLTQFAFSAFSLTPMP